MKGHDSPCFLKLVHAPLLIVGTQTTLHHLFISYPGRLLYQGDNQRTSEGNETGAVHSAPDRAVPLLL